MQHVWDNGMLTDEAEANEAEIEEAETDVIQDPAAAPAG